MRKNQVNPEEMAAIEARLAELEPGNWIGLLGTAVTQMLADSDFLICMLMPCEKANDPGECSMVMLLEASDELTEMAASWSETHDLGWMADIFNAMLREE